MWVPASGEPKIFVWVGLNSFLLFVRPFFHILLLLFISFLTSPTKHRLTQIDKRLHDTLSLYISHLEL